MDDFDSLFDKIPDDVPREQGSVVNNNSVVREGNFDLLPKAAVYFAEEIIKFRGDLDDSEVEWFPIALTQIANAAKAKDSEWSKVDQFAILVATNPMGGRAVVMAGINGGVKNHSTLAGELKDKSVERICVSPAAMLAKMGYDLAAKGALRIDMIGLIGTSYYIAGGCSGEEFNAMTEEQLKKTPISSIIATLDCRELKLRETFDEILGSGEVPPELIHLITARSATTKLNSDGVRVAAERHADFADTLDPDLLRKELSGIFLMMAMAQVGWAGKVQEDGGVEGWAQKRMYEESLGSHKDVIKDAVSEAIKDAMGDMKAQMDELKRLREEKRKREEEGG